MKNAIALILLVMCSGVFAEERYIFDRYRQPKADVKIQYVGEGRYACSGSTTDCAPVERDNRRLEQMKEHRRLEERQRQADRNWRRDVNDRLDDLESGAYNDR